MIPQKIDGLMKQSLMVCYVTSIWISPRKPKLATQKVSMNYVVALRVLEMTHQDQSKMLISDAVSTSWVIEPTSVAALLDVDHVLENDNCLRVVLSSASHELVDKKAELEKEWPKADDGTKAEGLYITRPRQAKKKKVAKSGAEGDAGDQKGKSKKSKKNKTQTQEEKPDAEKKKKVLKLKKAKALTEIPDFVAANLVKTGAGKKIIEDFMDKLKAKDAEVFPSSVLFSAADSTCKLNLPKVYGKSWSRIQFAAFEYFKQLLPGWYIEGWLLFKYF